MSLLERRVRASEIVIKMNVAVISSVGITRVDYKNDLRGLDTLLPARETTFMTSCFLAHKAPFEKELFTLKGKKSKGFKHFYKVASPKL